MANRQQRRAALKNPAQPMKAADTHGALDLSGGQFGLGGVKSIQHKMTTAKDAHYHTVGLCLARMFDVTQGQEEGPGGSLTQQYMAELMGDAEIIGTVALTLLGMVRQLADAREPGGFALMCTHLADGMVEDG